VCFFCSFPGNPRVPPPPTVAGHYFGFGLRVLLNSCGSLFLFPKDEPSLMPRMAICAPKKSTEQYFFNRESNFFDLLQQTDFFVLDFFSKIGAANKILILGVTVILVD